MNSETSPMPREPKNHWLIFETRCISPNVLIRFILAAALVLAATACKHNKRATTTVTRRAAFDLACPKEELKLNVVDVEGARKMATQLRCAVASRRRSTFTTQISHLDHRRNRDAAVVGVPSAATDW